MQPGDESPSQRLILLRLEGAEIDLPDGRRIGPIDWTIERGRRIAAEFADAAQWDALVDLLTGMRPPVRGTLEEVKRVRVQTDARARETMATNRTLQELLQSPEVPDTIWLDGRRHAVQVLVDQLGLSPAMVRRPLKFADDRVQQKAWALRLLLSQADLVIVRELLCSQDEEIQTALRRRWDDLPGALLAATDLAAAPGAVHGTVRFDAQGRFSLDLG